MSKEHWTPGPWRYDPTRDNLSIYDEGCGGSIMSGKTHIARVWSDTSENEDDYIPNAHLLAAAPELYAVLKKLAEYYLVEYCPVCGESDGAHHCKCALNAALKKARGEF